jgi:hypothetical protein
MLAGSAVALLCAVLVAGLLILVAPVAGVVVLVVLCLGLLAWQLYAPATGPATTGSPSGSVT